MKPKMAKEVEVKKKKNWETDSSGTLKSLLKT